MEGAISYLDSRGAATSKKGTFAVDEQHLQAHHLPAAWEAGDYLGLHYCVVLR
jgi:hypothetical protein